MSACFCPCFRKNIIWFVLITYSTTHRNKIPSPTEIVGNFSVTSALRENGVVIINISTSLVIYQSRFERISRSSTINSIISTGREKGNTK